MAVSERAEVRALWHLGHPRHHLVQRVRNDAEYGRALRSEDRDVPELGDSRGRQHRAQHFRHAGRRLCAGQQPRQCCNPRQNLEMTDSGAAPRLSPLADEGRSRRLDMWIVGVALTRRDTFIVLALLIVMLSPLVILRAWNDTFPSVNIAVIAVARAAGIASGEAAGAPLRKIAEFELPGPAGKRFDYLTIDEDDNYLLSAHLGAGLLHVVDLRANAVVKTVPDVPGIEGVAYIAEGKKIYTANWGENKIGVIDVARMAVVKRLPTEAKPDGITYADHFTKRTYRMSAPRRRASSTSGPTRS